MFKKTLLAAALGLSVVTMTACNDDDNDVFDQVEENQEMQSIAELVEDNDNFDTLQLALEATELDDVLNGTMSYTVFAPTDAAFERLADKLGFDNVADMLDDENIQSTLRDILLYHVVDGKVPKADIELGADITSEGGAQFEINKGFDDDMDSLYVTTTSNLQDNTAKITQTDIMASNGVVHVIDDVLLASMQEEDANQTIAQMLDSADEDYTFNILKRVLQESDSTLMDRLNDDDDYTVFAPTDDAFRAYAKERGYDGDIEDIANDPEVIEMLTPIIDRLVEYHIVEGSVDTLDIAFNQGTQTLIDEDITVMLDGNGMQVMDMSGDDDDTAAVVMPNLMASNGVIHVIDDILVPDTVVTDTNDDMDNDQQMQSIVDLVSTDPELSTLKEIVVAQGLVEAIQGGSDKTVFAPTNAAFDKFFAATGFTKALLTNPALKSQVEPVITYHLLTSELFADDLVPGQYDTANGAMLSINSDGNIVDAAGTVVSIQQTDIDATDGVVHKIDTVLMPPQ